MPTFPQHGQTDSVTTVNTIKKQGVRFQGIPVTKL
jgi:hypothetical protein